MANLIDIIDILSLCLWKKNNLFGNSAEGAGVAMATALNLAQKSSYCRVPRLLKALLFKETLLEIPCQSGVCAH